MSDFKLIPISRDSWGWQCSVLKLGGLTMLLDCGSPEVLEPSLLAPLIPHLGDLDVIVLSHADIKHLGALPYLMAKHTISCPILCTEPVCRLGELTCVAHLEDREKYQAPGEHFGADDVLRLFMSRITVLSYRETFQMQARGRTLTACPFPIGYRLGGAYWTLQCAGMSALYMVDGDVRRNRFLDGLELQRLLPSSRGVAQPWDVVITSSPPTLDALPHLGAEQPPQETSVPTKALSVARSTREQLLLEGTIATLRRGGSVLIPVDVAGTVPEVLLLLDAAWEQDRQLSSNYPLVWLSSMGDMVLDQIKTRLEWMSGEVLQRFEERPGSHPFLLKNVRILQSLEELCSAHPLTRPKVILTTMQTLDGGDSRELFMRMCGEPQTLLFLLGLPPSGTFARQLLDDFVIRHATRKEYKVLQHFREPLPEEQLRAYYETKIMELTESGQRVPPELAQFKSEIEELARVKLEGEGPPDASPPPPEEPDAPADAAAAPAADAAPPTQRKLATAKGPTSALWTPLGWPGSRTLAHNEVRSEGDEYGHLLSAAEMRIWKAQDQGSDRYGLAGAECDEGGAGAGGGSVGQVKAEEFAKQEDEAMDVLADWRDSLRVHFSEPMHYGVRERTLRVACRVRFLPDALLGPQDLFLLLRAIAPKHLALLPAIEDFSVGRSLQQYFQCCAVEHLPVPRVHMLGDELQLSLRTPKRRLQFSSELWPKVSFLKAKGGIRVARVRAAAPAGAAVGPLELGVCREDKPAAPVVSSASEAETAKSAEERLPRSGALFVPLGEEPLALSTLKDQLLRHEWTRDVSVEFQTPRAARLWSARVLAVGSKAALGWSAARGSSARSPSEGEGEAGRGAPPRLRLEGVPGEEFFAARASMYKRCALI